MPVSREEVLRRLREATEARDAIPEDQRTEFQRPDRFIGEAIGVDENGQPYPENRQPAPKPAADKPAADKVEKTDKPA